MPRRKKYVVGIDYDYLKWLEAKDAIADQLIAELGFDCVLSPVARKKVDRLRTLNKKWDKLDTDDHTKLISVAENNITKQRKKRTK